MTWDPKPSEKDLLAAIKSLDRPQVRELTRELIAYVQSQDEPYPRKNAERILRALRGQRHFVPMQLVADAFIQAGRDDPSIRLYYAQALLDQGNLSAAVAVLDGLVADTAQDEESNAEARGLLGRAYKQMYIAAEHGPAERRKRFLERAIAEYRGVYDESGRRWHGINAVALLDRARRDGIALDGVDDAGAAARALAEEILTTIEKLGADANEWDQGTALEACVALGRADKAVDWLADYLEATKDAFSVASTLRQLQEVWALDPQSDLGAQLLPVLQAELLDREGGPELELDASATAAARTHIDQASGLEKVFGKQRFYTLQWYRRGLDRCRAIARIEDPIEGGIGTGFLVEGESLKNGFPAVVLVTNAHVIPEALAAEQAQVSFRALESDVGPYHVTEIWSSPSEELDTTILALDGLPADALCCPLAQNPPNMKADTRTYIIGHPGGDVDVQLSLSDNLVLDHDETYLHYRTPTLGGSSGSPVFSRPWEVIAIHHAGDKEMPKLNGKPGTYAANEGIWMSRVREALAA
jgi:Trypsin-like peptidase domain/Tetratricopeptide Repeats-Sensor